MKPTDELRRVAEAALMRGKKVSIFVGPATEYIDTFTPPTVLRLLDVMDQMAEALKDYQIGASVKHPQITHRGEQALAVYNALK